METPNYSGDIIDMPRGMTDDDKICFIRNEIRKIRGNPDTAYPVNVPDKKQPITQIFVLKFEGNHE